MGQDRRGGCLSGQAGASHRREGSGGGRWAGADPGGERQGTGNRATFEIEDGGRKAGAGEDPKGRHCMGVRRSVSEPGSGVGGGGGEGKGRGGAWEDVGLDVRLPFTALSIADEDPNRLLLNSFSSCLHS